MTSMKVDLLKQVFKTQQKNQESTDHQHTEYMNSSNNLRLHQKIS